MSRRSAWAGRVGMLAACAAGAAAAASSAALADGDPASDVLLYQPVFFPYNQAPHPIERRLGALVRSANAQGYRIRIAVIQSRRDLGSVPMLFGRPAVYARFLSSELTSGWNGRVLVVMPSGYGLAQGARLVSSGGVIRIRQTAVSRADEQVLRRLAAPPSTSPATLVNAAGTAVRALAARHDVELTASSPAGRRSGGGASGRSRTVAAAVAAAVGLTAGLLWYLWRTRPRRPDAN